MSVLPCKSKAYSGPYVDIYEAVLPVASQGSNVNRQKHLYFDSTTELLDRVVYVGGGDGSVRIETHFQKWQMVNKVMIPGTITRLENGVTKLTLSIEKAEVTAAANNSAFQLP